MAELRGLPGVTKPLACQHVVSVEHVMRRIQFRRAVTAAGDTGAINVWRDDTRTLRSEFYRRRLTLNSAEHDDLVSLRRWLDKWWPKLGR